MAETVDVLLMLEEIISDHPLHKVIIGGDLNTELRGLSPFDPLWMDFLDKYELICCNQLHNNNNNNSGGGDGGNGRGDGGNNNNNNNNSGGATAATTTTTTTLLTFTIC